MGRYDDTFEVEGGRTMPIDAADKLELWARRGYTVRLTCDDKGGIEFWLGRTVNPDFKTHARTVTAGIRAADEWWENYGI